MVPAHAFFRHHYDGNGYGGGCFSVGHLDCIPQQNSYPLVGCAAVFHSSMGEEERGGTDRINNSVVEQEEDAGELGDSGFGRGDDVDVGDGGWLQLGIGCGGGTANTSPTVSISVKDVDNRPSTSIDNPNAGEEQTTAGLLDPRLFLDAVVSNSPIPSAVLAPATSGAIPISRGTFTTTTTMGPLFLQPSRQGSGMVCRRDAPEAPFGYWLATGASCSTLSPGPSCNTASGMFVAPLPPSASYGASWHLLTEGSADGYGLTAPDVLRVVVQPPSSRHHQQPGLWFVLLAAQNQAKEPFLPQISKSYLRIKYRNGRMTVLLLMKYLVKKLGLINENESQCDLATDEG